MNLLDVACRFRRPSGFTLDVRFAVPAGVTALFGPSGSGKSTTLNLLAGLLRPEEGRIVLNGRPLADAERRLHVPPHRRRLGFVFQDHRLFPHLTVRGNLRFGRRNDRGRIDWNDLLAILEIEGLLDRFPNTLSGGQMQRVALARALLCEPELLLLDEPLAALDQDLKQRILTYLERVLRRWPIPALFVSHDQADVRRFADQAVVLEEGRVVAAGPTGPALDRATLTGMKHPAAPSNLLRLERVERHGDHWRGWLGETAVHLPEGDYQPGGTVGIGFAPWEVILARGNPGEVSVRNRLPGTVRDLLPLGDRIYVAVDVGQFLWAQVTADAAREMRLAPGNSVLCLVKTGAIQVLG